MSEVPLYQDIGVQQLGLRRLILDAIALSIPLEPYSSTVPRGLWRS